MSKTFCISKDKLHVLLEKEVIEAADREVFNFRTAGLSLEEIVKQQTEEYGSFNDAISRTIKKFNHVTTHVEMHVALQLSDIYNLGPENEIKICFDMKDDFSGNIATLTDIVKNVETDTHVDATIQFNGGQARFQIKRYPSEYLTYDETNILSFLNRIFCKYGTMSDTNLIILLQPASKDTFKSISFKKIHQSLQASMNKISFGEVSFLFNANMEDITLMRVFPNLQSGSTPLRLLSEKYQDLKKKWADRVHNQRATQNNSGFPPPRE
ncbi:MAG: hypothetical protein COV91_04855 [Candidatus Taylorbacteria bacterium CG11_big_fil_rev_8_21_14_0_20_46_11]|uniref:Uncharacterized protein n=1 Tax=Candidatus Taylorbacteria bacterium CG11_big_fil_rev_8_21_14_0_20_46_11 TaxID=1975025 RepID=A0A2H0KAL7_9BACT|nr:MAG: hypothetical protein COV91_04855 [Candidatus Taylorbacteria bacterium CG11_big_fil_rev_8_21_14_0_20_46_11]